MTKQVRDRYDELLRRYGSRNVAEEMLIEDMKAEQGEQVYRNQFLNEQVEEGNKLLGTLEGKAGKGE